MGILGGGDKMEDTHVHEVESEDAEDKQQFN